MAHWKFRKAVVNLECGLPQTERNKEQFMLGGGRGKGLYIASSRSNIRK